MTCVGNRFVGSLIPAIINCSGGLTPRGISCVKTQSPSRQTITSCFTYSRLTSNDDCDVGTCIWCDPAVLIPSWCITHMTPGWVCHGKRQYVLLVPDGHAELSQRLHLGRSQLLSVRRPYFRQNKPLSVYPDGQLYVGAMAVVLVFEQVSVLPTR